MARIASSLTALAFALSACNASPSLTFVEDPAAADGGATTLDATGPNGESDAGDDAPPIDTVLLDAGAYDATCGKATVASCASCPGAPLLCAFGKTSTCVADCSACAPGWLPCLHCDADGGVLGKCLPLNGKGVLACNGGTRCACAAGAASCPVIAGAAQVCTIDAKNPKCFTCGEAKAAGGACVSANGVTGTCSAGDASPLCQ